jgi:hypothetical protein
VRITLTDIHLIQHHENASPLEQRKVLSILLKQPRAAVHLQPTGDLQSPTSRTPSQHLWRLLRALQRTRLLRINQIAHTPQPRQHHLTQRSGLRHLEQSYAFGHVLYITSSHLERLGHAYGQGRTRKYIHGTRTPRAVPSFYSNSKYSGRVPHQTLQRQVQQQKHPEQRSDPCTSPAEYVQW